MDERRSRFGVAPRLLAAQGLVLLAGAATSWIVASAVAPGIFHDHLARAQVVHTAAEVAHVDEAFADSLILALGVALVAAVLLALLVTWWFTTRVQRSTSLVARSAADIAEGHYSSRVESLGLGPEFDLLGDTINALAARLEAVETTRRRILADLAHEMRTPVATIEAYLEALEDGVRRLDHQTLAVLHSGTQRLQRLAEDIGAVSKAEEAHLHLRPEVMSARSLVDAAVGAAGEAFAAAGITISIHPSPVVSMVRVDPQRMAQVLSNLLDNALAHTHHGGSVVIAVTRPERSWVSIDVRDDGEGVAPEHLPHLFERFYRADPARSRTRGGSGIGLAISRALVEAHGGGLSAHSDGPGLGSTFTVRLPVVDSSADA